jgi:hypothetical protein
LKSRILGALGSLLILAVLPSVSLAVPMTWSYSGVCTSGDCSVVPSITGTLSGDPALWGPGSQLNEYVLWGDLTSYSFSIGSYDFTGVRGIGSYELDASGNIVGGSMTFANLLALEFLGVGNATWSFLDDRLFGRDIRAWGVGGYSNTSSIPVPEPGMLTLLGLSLLAIGLVRRRPHG